MDSRSPLYKRSCVRRAQVVQMLFVITYDAADEPQNAPVYSSQIQDTTPTNVLFCSSCFHSSLQHNKRLKAPISSCSYKEIIHSDCKSFRFFKKKSFSPL